MKIAVISSTVFVVPLQGYGGLEAIAHQSAEGLAKKGHDVTLYAPDGSRCDHARVREFGPTGGMDEKTAYSNYWGELPDYDVIIDHSWQAWSYVLKMEGKLKAPVLKVMHAPVNSMYQTLPPVEKPCMVCISRDQASHFEALFDREARVCHNGVDFSFYSPMEVKRTNRFLFLARFSQVKSPELAIDACIKAGAGLDLVGDTSITNEPEYLYRCQQKCDGERIRFVGPASRGECVRWYSQALAFVHPTRDFKEPFGLAPIEAMGCGLPVICWRKGAVKDTVIHNQTGWWVSSTDELAERIKQVNRDGVSDHMRKECVGWARRAFPIQKMIDRYEELCVEALDTGGW